MNADHQASCCRGADIPVSSSPRRRGPTGLAQLLVRAQEGRDLVRATQVREERAKDDCVLDGHAAAVRAAGSAPGRLG